MVKKKKIKIKKGSKTVKHFTAEQFIAIRKILINRYRDLSLFTVGCHLGWRGGDLLSLTWTQVLDESLLDIANTIRVEEQKTKRTADFPVSDPTYQSLNRWWVLNKKPLKGYVWESRKGGGAMRVEHLHYMINQWAEQAKVHGHFGSHSLRKTFGRAFLDSGGTVQQLAHYFGHKSIATTMSYLGLDDDEVNGVACSVDLTKEKKVKPEKKKKFKKKSTVLQGAFVTNVVNNVPPTETPLGAKLQLDTSKNKRGESQILADWRNLSAPERVNIFENMFQELKSKMFESLQGKRNEV